MKKNLQVAVAEPNPIFRKGLTEIIDKIDGIDVLLAAANDAELLASQIKQNPDIIMLGIDSPQFKEITDINSIKTKWPTAKVLVLSAYDHEFNIIRTLQKGANGYLSKKCDERQLHKALLSVYYTGFYNDALTEKGYHWLENNKNALPFISDVEYDFLKLLCQDMSYEEIAGEMNISAANVELYSEILMKKLNVTSRIGLIVSAYHMGLNSKVTGK